MSSYRLLLQNGNIHISYRVTDSHSNDETRLQLLYENVGSSYIDGLTTFIQHVSFVDFPIVMENDQKDRIVYSVKSIRENFALVDIIRIRQSKNSRMNEIKTQFVCSSFCSSWLTIPLAAKKQSSKPSFTIAQSISSFAAADSHYLLAASESSSVDTLSVAYTASKSSLESVISAKISFMSDEWYDSDSDNGKEMEKQTDSDKRSVFGAIKSLFTAKKSRKNSYTFYM